MKIKQFLCALLSSVMLLVSAPIVLADDTVNVQLNGQQLQFDVPAQIINGRTMVPLRAIFEALGATVYWQESIQTVTSTRRDATVKLTVNSNNMLVNDSVVTLDVAPCIIDGRTLVPVRAISEAFGLPVNWDEGSRTVYIGTYTPPVSYENATDVVVQINNYINSGMYIEAIQSCDTALQSMALSQSDIDLINSLKEDAQYKYSDYIESTLTDDVKISLCNRIKPIIESRLKHPAMAIWSDPLDEENVYYLVGIDEITVRYRMKASNGYGVYDYYTGIFTFDFGYNLIDYFTY